VQVSCNAKHYNISFSKMQYFFEKSVIFFERAAFCDFITEKCPKNVV